MRNVVDRQPAYRTRAVAKKEKEQEGSVEMIAVQDMRIKEGPESDETEQMNVIRQDLKNFTTGVRYSQGAFQVKWPTIEESAKESEDSSSHPRRPFQENQGWSISGLVRGSFGNDKVRINIVVEACESSTNHERWHRNGCAMRWKEI